MNIDPALQNIFMPMYSFMLSFSSLEIYFVSVTPPRILFRIGSHTRNISNVACVTQTCFLLLEGTIESFLLVVMAYNHSDALCIP